jgi:hypothetical protein
LQGVAVTSEVLAASHAAGPRRRLLRPQPALQHIRKSLHLLDGPIRGCKLMLDQLSDCRVTLAELDAAFPGSKYIILYRQSLIEQFVSIEAAVATQQWALVAGQQRREALIVVNPTKLRSFCNRTREQYQAVLDQAWLEGRSVLLSYEGLIADPQRCLRNQICPLLEVPFAEPRTVLQKQNTLPLAERIANYGQVAGLVSSPLCQQHHSWHRQQRAVRRAA